MLSGPKIPPLLTLPAELLALIASSLNKPDFLAVRTTAKPLERACFPLFGRRFFRKKGFMITTESLSVLANVADHHELRKYVQHVWFNPDCYTFCDAGTLPFRDSTRVAKFEHCTEDHRSLMVAETLSQHLSKILPKLHNLIVVGIRRGEDHTPWGWRHLFNDIKLDPRKLGTIPTDPIRPVSGPTVILQALIQVLAAHNIRLVRLYTDAIEVDAIIPASVSHESISSCCASLMYVEVTVVNTGSHVEMYQNMDMSTHHSERPKPGRDLAVLLASMPKLRELALQIFPDKKQSLLAQSALSNLDSLLPSYHYLCFKTLTDNVRLSVLTRLKLENLTTTALQLQMILTPCQRTLTSLKLRDVRLLDRGPNTGQRSWAPLFSFLACHFLSLSYVLFYRLMHTHGGVIFNQLPTRALRTNSDAFRIMPAEAFSDERFVQFEDLIFEVHGRSLVSQRLPQMIDQHSYLPPIFSYDLDEDAWHTDTSDEEEIS